MHPNPNPNVLEDGSTAKNSAERPEERMVVAVQPTQPSSTNTSTSTPVAERVGVVIQEAAP